MINYNNLSNKWFFSNNLKLRCFKIMIILPLRNPQTFQRICWLYFFQQKKTIQTLGCPRYATKGSSSGDIAGVKHLFIAIIFWYTLTLSSRTCSGLIFGTNLKGILDAIWLNYLYLEELLEAINVYKDLLVIVWSHVIISRWMTVIHLKLLLKFIQLCANCFY